MNNKSFTLIELLVVIVIIGILAGVIMISTSSSIDKANIAKSKVFEESIANNLAANMVSKWKLDEVNGTSIPDAWGSNTGTLYGTNGLPQLRLSSECVTEKCLLFDGTDDYMATNFNFTEDDLTLSAWGKISEYGDGSVAFSSGTSFSFGIWMQAGLMCFGLWGDTVSQKTIYQYNPDKNWHHYVLAYDYSSGYGTAYVDGKIQGVPYYVNDTIRNSTMFYVGGKNPNEWYFNGSIDDVRIYDVGLSSSQIKQNYIAGLDSLLSQGNISKEDYNQRINALAYE